MPISHLDPLWWLRTHGQRRQEREPTGRRNFQEPAAKRLICGRHGSRSIAARSDDRDRDQDERVAIAGLA